VIELVCTCSGGFFNHFEDLRRAFEKHSFRAVQISMLKRTSGLFFGNFSQN
jgi:hypothetical protein